MKTYMPLNGLRWSRNSGSANCDMPQSAVFGRPGGGAKITTRTFGGGLRRSTVVHFARKVSYNAGAATDDCVGQCKSPLQGHYR